MRFNVFCRVDSDLIQTLLVQFKMSPSKKRNRRTKCNELIRRTDNLTKVLQMSKAMQTRFQLIPASALNDVTVAGIRDMSLGRVRNGQPVGMIE